jgi:hypothetical protein
MFSNGIDSEVLRLQTFDVKTAFKDNKPAVFIAEGNYFGFGYKNEVVGDLREFTPAEVLKIVEKAFAGNVVSKKIDSKTSIIIAPDHWNMQLPDEYIEFEKNLLYLPFHMVLHQNVDEKKVLKKLITPKNAVKLILQQGKLIKALSKSDVLLSIPGHSQENSYGLSKLPDDDFVEEFARFDFNDQRKFILASKSGRRRNKSSSKKKSSSKRSLSKKKKKKKNVVSKKKKSSKKLSKKQIANYKNTMKAFKKNLYK